MTGMEIFLEWANAQRGRKKLVADELGIAYPTINIWMETGRIPAERCPAVERVTGIPRHRLRPDVYDAPGDAV